MLYSTFLGGSGDDIATAIAVDPSGNAAVTGTTYSQDFPVVNAFQKSLGGSADVFLTRLDASGSNLTYSTYLGGSSDEWGMGVALDAQGSAYLTGYTGSTAFPTFNAAEATLAAPGFDSFVTRFNPAGSALVYSTFLGGTGMDLAFSIAVDAQGSAYVTGETGSTDFATGGALQTGSGGKTDGFLAKLTSSGGFEYRSYLGGGADDSALSVALDAAGTAYLAGVAQSPDAPLSFGGLQTNLQGSSGRVDSEDRIRRHTTGVRLRFSGQFFRWRGIGVPGDRQRFRRRLRHQGLPARPAIHCQPPSTA